MRKARKRGISTGRSAKAAGLEVGVSKVKELASRWQRECGAATGVDVETRLKFSIDALEAALELSQRATRVLRGRDW